MFNNKLINLGAIALMIYCFTEFRNKNYPDGAKMPAPISSMPAKYKLDWDLNDENSKSTTAGKVLHYLLSDKIEKSALVRASKTNTIKIISNGATIGDSVDISYIIIRNNQQAAPEELNNFMLLTDSPLSDLIIGMTSGSEKIIAVKKGSKESELFKTEVEDVSVKIKIKSLHKANN